ncbi:MBL fold metallo-hydrolase [Patescibacteria group bacterium]|nr:MBL fold metallo-hydrolase [Patescibacteria group bacterium]MBU3999592.1 MBL fold metallo-hydrolase [Patescibacteria group bacterium]MBU4056595.1 MBL fold metallo-hydrolase [Patescibacteria group bacterium]MBU4369006.1 MBL fold metallo-hydrolase [Patescibacteria group bacterium]
MNTEVKIIKPGYFKWIGKNRCKTGSNVILIRDSGKNILVDTGSQGEDKKIIVALKKEKLKPENIDIVIITHPHADHIGNNFLFKNALFVDSLGEFRGDKFLLAKAERRITENVSITKTPGHALEDISIIAKNTKKGTIAVIGDLFWKAGDNKLIVFESPGKLKQSRKKILKIADWIIPGHGKMFKPARCRRESGASLLNIYIKKI